MNLPTSRLREMCEFVVDCPHFTPEWTKSGFLVIRNQNIRDGRLDLSDPSFTHEEDFNRRNRRAKPQAGDIIFTREAPMGEVCIVPAGLECCIGQRQVLLRPGKDVDGRYLFYALRSNNVRHQIFWSEGTGSTVSNVRIPILEALRIPRLGSAEATVGSLLGVLDDKIDLNARTNQTLEAMARAIFKDWFIDYGPTRAKLENRVPYLAPAIWGLFPDRLDAEGKPAGWSCPTFEELVVAKQGKYLAKEEMSDSQSNEFPYPVWGGNGILGFSGRQAYTTPITLMTCRGSNCGLIRLTESGAWVTNNAIACAPIRGSTYFLYLYFTLESFADCISGSAQPQITYSALRHKRMRFPLEMQICDAFSDQVEPLFAKVLSNNRQSESLSSVRDLLLPKLMSGEVSVNVPESMVEAAA